MPIVKLNTNEVEQTRLEVESNIDKILSDPNDYQFNLDNHMIRPYNLVYHMTNLII